MTYFQVGSLAISALWIAIIGAFFIAAILNRVVTGKKAGDWYWNGLFLYFVTWKLSYIVFNFDLFLDMPMSVIYFNGGAKGHILALAVLSAYLLIFASKRFSLLYEESSRVFLLYFTSYKAVFGFLEKSSTEMLSHLVLLSGFLLILLSQKKKNGQLSRQMFLLFLLLELLSISLFDSIFSLESLTVIWLGTIVFTLGIKAEKGAGLLE